jgi:hypothetical protein
MHECEWMLMLLCVTSNTTCALKSAYERVCEEENVYMVKMEIKGKGKSEDGKGAR